MTDSRANVAGVDVSLDHWIGGRRLASAQRLGVLGITGNEQFL